MPPARLGIWKSPARRSPAAPQPWSLKPAVKFSLTDCPNRLPALVPPIADKQPRQSDGRQAQHGRLGNGRIRQGVRVECAGSRGCRSLKKLSAAIDRPPPEETQELKASAKSRSVVVLNERKSELYVTVEPAAVLPDNSGVPLIVPRSSAEKVTVSRLVREPVPSTAGVSRTIDNVSLNVPLPSKSCSAAVPPKPVATVFVVVQVIVSVAIWFPPRSAGRGPKAARNSNVTGIESAQQRAIRRNYDVAGLKRIQFRLMNVLAGDIVRIGERVDDRARRISIWAKVMVRRVGRCNEKPARIAAAATDNKKSHAKPRASPRTRTRRIRSFYCDSNATQRRETLVVASFFDQQFRRSQADRTSEQHQRQ